MGSSEKRHAEPKTERVRACLRRVLASRGFEASPKIRAFLTYLVEASLAGDASRLKAYTLGVDVFDRPPHFDPESDSIVRVSAGRLRAMLNAYYEGEGRHDPLRILLRKGSYAPDFAEHQADWPRHNGREAFILIAVERLQAIGNFSALDCLAAGLTDELVSALSGFGENLIAVRAPARNGDELASDRSLSHPGLVFHLRGSVRHHGESLRICINLMDAASGCVLWSEIFSPAFSLASLWDTQERIARKVAASVLDPHGILYVACKRKPAALLGSHLAVFRYREYQECLSPKAHLQARDALERAIGEEPGDADARAALANVYLGEALYGFNQSQPLPGLIERSLATAHTAVALEPRNAMANYVLAMVLFYRKDRARFLAQAQQALSLAPQRPDNLAVIGMHLALAGQWERGLELMAVAMEMNPFHPAWHYLAYSAYHLHFGHFDTALDAIARFTCLDFFPFQINLAVIHGYLGNQAEASRALERMSTLWPGARQRMGEILDFWFPFDDLAAIFAEGLARAGWHAPQSLRADPHELPNHATTSAPRWRRMT